MILEIFFELENEDYYKPMRVGSFCSNIYIKYESNGDGDKNLSINKNCNKIKQYSKAIILDLQKSGNCKSQITIAINFISSKDTNKERKWFIKKVMIKSYDLYYHNQIRSNPQIKLLNSFLNRFFLDITFVETQMKGSAFILDSVNLLYYKCNKIHFKVVVQLLILHTG